MRRVLAATVALATLAGTSLPVAALACSMRQRIESRCCCPESGGKNVLRPDCCKVVERSVQRTTPLSTFAAPVPAILPGPAALSFAPAETVGFAPALAVAPAQRAAGPPIPLRI